MADPKPIDHRAVAWQIANALGEKDRVPRTQIFKIVKICGSEQALSWLAEAQAIEAAGGMLTADGTRRRTPGGVYFAHVRDSLYRAGRRNVARQIFWKPRNTMPSSSPPAEASPEPVPPAQWSERGAWVTEVRADVGKATSVKVTIIGRPARVVERPGFVLFQLTHDGALPTLPKGLPVPDTPPATTYMVYVGAKQWRGVAQAIAAPDDALVIEGVQWYDPEFEAIVVMAMKTSTKALLRAGRPSATDAATPGA